MSQSWKGKTLNQVVSSIQKNQRTGGARDQWFRAQPIKHYRREIAVAAPHTYNPRSSVTIDGLNMPGGSIVRTPAVDGCHGLEGERGLANTIDISQTTNRAENYTCPLPDFMSPDANARRRVRSAGMIPRKFNENKNGDRYATSYNEYLVSRNRTIQQNGYVHLRKGDSGAIPGSVQSKSNVYSPNGISHCYQPPISEDNGNNRFQYQWIDGQIYDVVIPYGMYSLDSLSTAFRTIMTTNHHYLIMNGNQKTFLLDISYDLNTNNVILIATTNISTDSYPWPTYQVPPGQSWSLPTDPDYPAHTTFIILDNGFQDVIGFVYGTYTGPGPNYSNYAPVILPNYVKLHYKPSNVGFATQGAVDSSLYTVREKFNVINTVAGQSTNIFGQATANAMAYNTHEDSYTLKTKYGFRDTLVPIILANGTLKKCDKYRYRR